MPAPNPAHLSTSVASRSGDLVEFNDNDVSVSNYYEDELNADSVFS